MNNKNILIAIVSFLLFVSNSQAQIRDIKWEPFLQHPCYKGLSVSVLNMGWSNDVKTYLWGVRIKNNYNTAVSFRYLLDVGDEKKGLTKNYYEAAYRLKPGDSLTNGDDALRGIIFKTSSSEWTVMVGDVCFDGMRCGGEDDCYADCDVVARKVNQLCGLEAHTSTKKEKAQQKSKEEEETEEGDIKPGLYTRDKKTSVVVKVEKDDISLTIHIDTKKFVQIKTAPGIYTHKFNDGIISTSKSTSPGKFNYIEVNPNGVMVVNESFTYKDSIVKQENKPVTVEKGKITVWRCNEGGEHKMEMKDDGLYFSAIYPDEDRSKSAFFKKVSATTYIYISKISGGHRVVFQGEGRMYYESYDPRITSRIYTHCDYYLVK